jgi:phage terminase Nu1 subunit (DNA packaging protein)
MSEDDDGLSVPDFLRISAEDRRRAWERSPPRSTPALERKRTATEIAYYASIAAEMAAKRAADAIRFKVLRARAAAEKAERQAIKQSVKQRTRVK